MGYDPEREGVGRMHQQDHDRRPAHQGASETTRSNGPDEA